MGKFLTFEGGDGVGKSQLLTLLKTYLDEQKVNYAVLKFPLYDVTFYGKLVKRYLAGEFGPLNEQNPYNVAWLYAGDRLEYRNNLTELINQHDLVICDRYVTSNLAYGMARFEGNNDARLNFMYWLRELEYGHNQLPRPDLILYLDVPSEIQKEFLAKRDSGGDIHENDLSYQEKVRSEYLWLANNYPKNWITLDVTIEPDPFLKIYHDSIKNRQVSLGMPELIASEAIERLKERGFIKNV
jgi:dTMP kinase